MSNVTYSSLFFSGKENRWWYNAFRCHVVSDYDRREISKVMFPIKSTAVRAYTIIEQESRLSMAILSQAIRDLTATSPEISMDSVRWFISRENQSHPHSFTGCCNMINRRLMLLGHDNLIEPSILRDKCLDDPDAMFVSGTSKIADHRSGYLHQDFNPLTGVSDYFDLRAA